DLGKGSTDRVWVRGVPAAGRLLWHAALRPRVRCGANLTLASEPATLGRGRNVRGCCPLARGRCSSLLRRESWADRRPLGGSRRWAIPCLDCPAPTQSHARSSVKTAVDAPSGDAGEASRSPVHVALLGAFELRCSDAPVPLPLPAQRLLA